MHGILVDLRVFCLAGMEVTASLAPSWRVPHAGNQFKHTYLFHETRFYRCCCRPFRRLLLPECCSGTEPAYLRRSDQIMIFVLSPWLC